LDLKQIKQIIELMKRSELTEFAVEEEGFKLKIRRGTNGLPIVSTSRGSNSPFPTVDTAPPMPVAPAQAPSVTLTPAAPKDEAGIAYIKSPMVGTFYRAALRRASRSPTSAPRSTRKSVCCIIEAMKIMNEIQAETKGSVLEVLVETASRSNTASVSSRSSRAEVGRVIPNAPPAVLRPSARRTARSTSNPTLPK